MSKLNKKLKHKSFNVEMEDMKEILDDIFK